MDLWQQIREKYAQGGVTHRELAEEYGVSLCTLRRKAAEEKWSSLKKQRSAVSESESPAARLRLDRQLAAADRLLEVFMRALENDAEFYTYIDIQKTSSGIEYVSQRMENVNIDRIGKLIKAVADVFELQRIALGLHDYKDELSARKIEQDGDIANRKLALERMKLEGLADNGAVDDGFLEALGAGLKAADAPDGGEYGDE